jgi:hypothetical protein
MSNLRAVPTFSAKDLSLAAHNAKTGKPFGSMDTITHGFGLKGRRVSETSEQCFCKVVEVPGNAELKKYYIGINADGNILDPISGGGAKLTKRAGWVTVSQEDFDLYYQEIKNGFTTVNITNIRAKYRTYLS